MRKIIDYKIINKGRSTDLEDEVKEHIANGFEPYGFMEISGEYQYTFYQVMVKYES